ncbi:DUF1918 domain-containing protein [Streptomyces pinistramenti]|uniref:DUF1918 domain-containing protein n=1 Tax=Streptomyces pinistramenti TaxID=2884812 RepID=UPI001D05CDA1|nr:DUF1918 domain-containing protein [Streptomyces pinistramenti]MCB5911121.1 DUF1918 domain-containing protein [Streptomyces pinistramenti]
MHATTGDQLLVHGRTVGQHDHVVKIIEVLGENGTPPYRVRGEDGHEKIMSPGPDTTVRHEEPGSPMK